MLKCLGGTINVVGGISECTVVIVVEETGLPDLPGIIVCQFRDGTVEESDGCTNVVVIRDPLNSLIKKQCAYTLWVESCSRILYLINSIGFGVQQATADCISRWAELDFLVVDLLDAVPEVPHVEVVCNPLNW